MQGWIKLHRSISEWEWFSDMYVWTLFTHLLVEANHEERKWKGVILKPGDVIFGLPEWSKKTGISIQSLRTALDRLKSTGELTRKNYNKFSVISINNWDEYQTTNRRTNSHLTGNQQATNNIIRSKEDIRSKEIDIYLSLFNSLFGGKYQSTVGRIAKLALRLHTFSLEQVLEATRNLSSDDFYQGKNDRGWKADPDFLLRSDEQIDKWLNTLAKKETKPKVFITLKEKI